MNKKTKGENNTSVAKRDNNLFQPETESEEPLSSQLSSVRLASQNSMKKKKKGVKKVKKSKVSQ